MELIAKGMVAAIIILLIIADPKLAIVGLSVGERNGHLLYSVIFTE